MFPGGRSGRKGKPIKPVSHSTIDKAWRKLRTLAGIPDAVAHDMRRAFATRAANKLPLATAMSLTGHTTMRAFAIYYGRDPEAAAAAATVMGDAYKVIDLAAERKKRSA